VDVAVHVDLTRSSAYDSMGSELELGRWEFGVSVFMGGFLSPVVPRMSAFCTGWIRFRTIMRNITRSRS
jgi:hypothetical protein